jgi:hypothetical protein
MHSTQSFFIRPASSEGAMSLYTGTLVRAGNLQLQIQNRIEPASAPPIRVKLWIGGNCQGEKTLYHGNMWGDPGPQPMVSKGEAIKVRIVWKDQPPKVVQFSAFNKPENISVFKENGHLRVVHNGGAV